MKFYAGTVSRTFDNGMRSFVLPLGGGAVELQCFVATGSIHEAGYLGCGISHFVEHMLFQGCRDFPGTAAADTVSSLGGSCNAYTSVDRTVYHISIAPQHLETALKIMSSMVRCPEFSADSFEAEKQVIMRECDRGFDNVSSRLFNELTAGLFLHHPLRVPVIGYPELLKGVTREAAADYHARRYVPQRCFLVAAGAVEPESFNVLAEKYFGDWARSNLDEPALPADPPPAWAGCREFVFAEALERLAAAVRLPEFADPMFPAADVLFGAMGSGSGSRLVRSLELQKQLAIDLRGFCIALPGGGIGGICGAAVPGKFGKLEKELHRELDAIASGVLTADEIEREKRQQYADHLRRMRDLSNVAGEIGGAVLAAGTPEFADLYLDRIAAVTPEAVCEAAAELLQPCRRLTVRQLTGARKHHSAGKKSVSWPVFYTELPDGQRIAGVTDRRIPLVECSVMLPWGSFFETSQEGGISMLAGAMLSAGTKRRTEAALLTGLDELGAEFTAETGFNSGVVTLSAPRRSFGAAFRLLTEILTASKFDEVPFEREKQRILELLRSRAMLASSAGLSRARQLLFGADHPFAFGRNGTMESVQSLSARQVKDFYLRRWIAGRVIIGFSGDCTPDDMVKWSRRLFDAVSWQSDSVPAVSLPEFPGTLIRDEIALPREQSAVLRLFPGAPLGISRDRAPLEVFSQSENGLSSRIFKLVRNDNALAYSVGMEMMGGFHPGCFAFHVATDPDGIVKADRLIDDELRRLCETGLSQEEFSAARESALFAALRDSECCDRRMNTALLNLHYGLPVDEQDDLIARLRGLDRSTVNAVIAKYCAGSACGVSVHSGKLKR